MLENFRANVLKRKQTRPHSSRSRRKGQEFDCHSYPSLQGQWKWLSVLGLFAEGDVQCLSEISCAFSFSFSFWLSFVTWFFSRFFVSIMSHVSEESHQSSACFRFFLGLACFEYSLLASEENEKDREISLLVLLSEACSESPHLSEPSVIFLNYEWVTDQSPHDFGWREPIERGKLRMFLRGLPSPQSFVQQNKTCNTRSFEKLSYDRNKNWIPNLRFFLAGGHASPGKLKFYTREE